MWIYQSILPKHGCTSNYKELASLGFLQMKSLMTFFHLKNTKILMTAVLPVSIFSYFPLLSRVFKKASLSIIIQSHHCQMVDQQSLKFLEVERNFSISHDHICFSKLRYPRQTVLIWMVQVRLVLQSTPLQACSIKWMLFWVVN